MWKKDRRKTGSGTLHSLLLTSGLSSTPNKLVCGLGIELSLTSPLTTPK